MSYAQLAKTLIFNEKTIAAASKYSGKVIEWSMDDNVRKCVALGGTLTGVASLATAGLSAAQGQATGGLADLGKGFLDLGQDDFREDGSDQTGTLYGNAGKLIQNLGIGAFNLAVAGGQFTGKLNPAQLEILKKVSYGLMAWQGATTADEFVRSDSAGIGDTVDKIGGGISLLGLANTVGTINNLIK